MKVFLDAGHGGSDPGAVSGGLVEKNMTLICANGAKNLLEKYGIDVKMSRTGDNSFSLYERADMANAWGADLFVSCHFNAGGGNRGEVIHSVFGGKGQILAQNIANELKNLGQENVRIYSKGATNGSGDYFTVIAKTNMPAVIVEPCFIDNDEDRVLADTEDKQYLVGVAIAKGILNFYGLSYAEDEFMELNEINDIVYELKIRGIISDTELWLKKLSEDSNAYWLSKKAIDFIRRNGV
ncbi:MAG: N-acetylmuramoyl-L-alanine amidase [Clostridia bacterium]|nr:N-acetylmuramoyl-L-alanine amidase [Clostridia bacterium]